MVRITNGQESRAENLYGFRSKTGSRNHSLDACTTQLKQKAELMTRDDGSVLGSRVQDFSVTF